MNAPCVDECRSWPSKPQFTCGTRQRQHRYVCRWQSPTVTREKKWSRTCDCHAQHKRLASLHLLWCIAITLAVLGIGLARQGWPCMPSASATECPIRRLSDYHNRNKNPVAWSNNFFLCIWPGPSIKRLAISDIWSRQCWCSPCLGRCQILTVQQYASKVYNTRWSWLSDVSAAWLGSCGFIGFILIFNSSCNFA